LAELIRRRLRPLARLALIFVGIECGLRLLAAGFRVQQFYLAEHREEGPDPGAYRILCVGESTTRGFPGPLAQSYPAQLEDLLRARHPGANVKVYNRGVSAISAYDIYAHLPKYLRQTRPQLVVLQAGNNMGSIWPDSQAAFLDRSMTFRLGLLSWRILALAWRGRLIVSRAYHDAYLVPKEGVRREMDQQTTRRYMDLCVRRIQEEGARVILLGYFNSPDGSELLREAARSLGVPFCPTYDIYQDYARKGRASELISEDGWHPSELGYRLMARRLAQAVERAPGFPGAAPSSISYSRPRTRTGRTRPGS